MKKSIFAKTVAALLTASFILTEGVSAKPTNEIADGGEETASQDQETEDVTGQDQMPEFIAEGYLGALPSVPEYATECTFVPVSDSGYPELVIWDHDRAVLSIYKMNRNGICIYCGDIELPAYENEDYGNSQYHVYFHENKGILALEEDDYSDRSREERHHCTVYSIEDITARSEIQRGTAVPVLWDGGEERSFSGGRDKTVYQTINGDNLSKEEYYEEKEQVFPSDDRKELCGLSAHEGRRWLDATDYA
ncbi:MAG: hypothetical protein K6G83_15460 [Lachnospiraceae bacterium]|nr:hypothetical protein [Lachnospiraceae bacterium]